MINAISGKLLDAYASATTLGSRLVQGTTNKGANQEWELKPAAR